MGCTGVDEKGREIGFVTVAVPTSPSSKTCRRETLNSTKLDAAQWRGYWVF